MIKSGLWIELEALIGFTVALGLGSLIGQRTVTVIMMIVLEVVLTPILSRVHIPHFSNLQRSVVGLATAHLAPGSLPVLGGGGGGHDGSVNSELLPESIRVAVIVVIAWIVGWTDPRGVANDDPRRLMPTDHPAVALRGGQPSEVLDSTHSTSSSVIPSGPSKSRSRRLM